MNEWLTVGEIERQTRIPERTLRRYLELHGHHLQTRRQGRSVVVAESVIAILRQIRDWYETGWNAERVEAALSESGLPVTVAIDGHQRAMTATEALQTLQQTLAALATEMADLRQDVIASRQATEQLRRVMDDRLDARDRQLMETMRVMQQQAVEQTQAPKRSWWPWKR